MKISFTRSRLKLAVIAGAVVITSGVLMSSSHREAPMIAEDPVADNTDVYAFKSPTDESKIIIIANFYPGQLRDGGPNYYHFGENVRYEIRVDNNVNTKGDDVIYRFTFYRKNEDPTTFFNIRLGKENLRTTYGVERSTDGGKSFHPIVFPDAGIVAPYNIGPRSISSPVGLNAPDYNTLMKKSVIQAGSGERIFAGPVEDPFFVDAGGIFDLGDAPRQNSRPRDHLKCKNVLTIAIEANVNNISKDGRLLYQAKNILDPDFVVGIWASASRRKIRVLNGNGTESHNGPWIQVSRLGMPLTNEVVIPIGDKDLWNSLTPYDEKNKMFYKYFYNPELALYMDDDKFGKAVPAFTPLRIQKKSLGMFDFSNGGNGLHGLKGNPALNGTALAENSFGPLLLPAPNSPRSVDLWPIFHTGVPNMRPYQLATGKGGNPLAAGKPFINNFLPNGGDMLRLNLATPATPRNSPDFSPLGLVQAAVLGLTDPRFNKNTDLEFIPNMDGFPNGRRLEDDVTRIELQAVSGVVLAAIGLWYDDFVPGQSPVTQDLLDVLTYNTRINANDTTFKTSFPFVQTPWQGTADCDCGDAPQDKAMSVRKSTNTSEIGLAAPEFFVATSPNPIGNSSTLTYKVTQTSNVKIVLFDAIGTPVKVLVNKRHGAGTYTLPWNANGFAKGTYFISASKNGEVRQSLTVIKN